MFYERGTPVHPKPRTLKQVPELVEESKTPKKGKKNAAEMEEGLGKPPIHSFWAPDL